MPPYALLRLAGRRVEKQIHTCSIIGLPYYSDGWWLEKNKPRRFPYTKEERRDAARRYGLREEDYEPYLQTDEPTGDYPNLGHITGHMRDPYENWSHKFYRRNFGEPVPYHWASYHPQRQNHTGIENEYQAFTVGNLVFIFAFWGGVALFMYWAIYICNLDFVQSLMPKQFAYDFKRAFPVNDPQKFPIVNYTFEAENAPDEHQHGHH